MTEVTRQKYLCVKEYYLNFGSSITQSCKLFGIDRGKFSNFLKFCGVPVVNKQNQPRINVSIFDDIDTEEKAYWLGFLFADGCVSSSDNTIELSLKSSDFEHLIKFKKFLDCSLSVKVDSIRCRLAFSDKHVKARLVTLGCTPRKSLTLKFPTHLDKNLLRHFIRGYVDGDGSLYVTKRQFHLSILGTKEFLLVLLENLQIKATLHRKDKSLSNTFFISFSGKKAKTICTFLYEGSVIYLERKYAKYVQNCRIVE